MTDSGVTWEATVAADVACRLGEGPWWDATRERLAWVDITDGLVRTLTPASGETTVAEVGEPVGFVVGRAGGGFVAGTSTGLVALDDELQLVGHLVAPPDLLGGRRRINDGACDPAGRVLVGSVDPATELLGTLWSWSPAAGFRALVEGVGMSNGVAFSPGGDWLYFVDSATQRVDRFVYDAGAGSAGQRTPFHEVPRGAGVPDGLAVDAEGCVWIALWGSGAVWRLSPEGERLGTVRTGASRTTCCAFGGAGRECLYITSANEGGGEDTALDVSGAPGALFAADVGVAGAPVFEAEI